MVAMGQPCSAEALAAWNVEELARVAARPAPRWYDEGLGPEFRNATNPSMVFGEEYVRILDEFFLGLDPNAMCSTTEGEGMRVDQSVRRGEAHSGMTLLHFAASCADVPYMKALLRCGATLDFGADGPLGSPLHQLAQQYLVEGDDLDGRSRLAAIQFLLDAGADPRNTSRTEGSGKGTPGFRSKGTERLLKVLLRERDEKRALELGERLLTAPGSAELLAEAPDFASHCRGGRMRKAFKVVLERARAAPRRARTCPCGGGA